MNKIYAGLKCKAKWKLIQLTKALEGGAPIWLQFD